MLADLWRRLASLVWGRWLLAAGVATAALLLPDLIRAGYSPDEEFTRFAVRGIHAHGLPLLPSGLFYDRGLLYSYAAALAGLTAGDSLVPGRLVSLAAAAAALAVIFHEMRRMASPGAGALAVVLAAASLPFWVSATTARFYAPFLLGYLVVLACLSRLSLSWAAMAALASAAAVTRWTHELAFTLLAVPVRRRDRRRAARRAGHGSSGASPWPPDSPPGRPRSWRCTRRRRRRTAT